MFRLPCDLEQSYKLQIAQLEFHQGFRYDETGGRITTRIAALLCV